MCLGNWPFGVHLSPAEAENKQEVANTPHPQGARKSQLPSTGVVRPHSQGRTGSPSLLEVEVRVLKEQVDPRCCCSCPTAKVNLRTQERWVCTQAGRMPGKNGSKEALSQGCHSPKERVNHVP